MTLEQVDAELIARGFGGFDPQERYRYINWGYFQIAKFSQWSWEKKTEVVTFAVGDYRKTVAPTWAGTLVAFIVMDPFRTKLTPMSDVQFLEDWYPLDLASSSHRGEPESYFVWTEDGTNYLYILPPPESTRDVNHVYSQKVVSLSEGDPTNAPITPEDLDEAIVLAALVRCHIRANEWDLASNVRAMLEEQFDLQLNVEALGMDEAIERVEPYPWP